MGRLVALTAAFLFGVATLAQAGTVSVAAGADFAKPMVDLKAAFEAASGHTVEVKTASIAKMLAQIRGGAPFDVLLSSGPDAVSALEAEGFALGETRFSYALGRLTLWSRDKRRIGPEGNAVLTMMRYKTLAMADPNLDPYGHAAQEVLTNIGIWDKVQKQLLIAENSTEAKLLTASGKAEIGLLPSAAVATLEPDRKGSGWMVPLNLHTPLRQDAVLLKGANGNAAAREFLTFLKTPAARAIIVRYGYGFE